MTAQNTNNRVQEDADDASFSDRSNVLMVTAIWLMLVSTFFLIPVKWFDGMPVVGSDQLLADLQILVGILAFLIFLAEIYVITDYLYGKVSDRIKKKNTPSQRAR